MKLKSIRIDGLFGEDTQPVEIEFNKYDPITILTGPNGSGKTHVLKILSLLAMLDFESLFRLPFKSIQLTYSDNGKLTVTKNSNGLKVNGHEKLEHEFYLLPEELESVHAPARFERLDFDTWIDRTDGEVIPRERMQSMFGNSGKSIEERIQDNPWLSVYRAENLPILIATARLDREPVDLSDRYRRISHRVVQTPRVSSYIERIRAMINDARKKSLTISQRADRDFASRALEKSGIAVDEVELRERYAKVASLHQELHANGLTEETLGVDFPHGDTEKTERRILNIFLDDWEKKLEPLLPVHRKLELFKHIVGKKLQNKEMAFDVTGDLHFVSTNLEELDVSMLSSGEQHLLALYSLLLFTAEVGSLVLIDEPEISFHASWKHAFLQDIYEVSELNDLQVVVATHSSAIVQGEWDMVVEIGSR